MDHSKHARLTDADFTDTTLSGATVYGPGDERIGHVSEVLGRGADCRVVVDVGGFLGLGAKPVAVNARELDFMRDSSNSVHAVTTWTKDDLSSMPEYTG